jgi:hypothetical protein
LWQRIIGTSPTPPDFVVPSGWPTKQPAMIGPEINHRNVDLYHLILNGTTDFVQGSGSIFQTWLTADHSAIDLTGEDYAFKSHQLPALVRLLMKVDVKAVKAGFVQWLSAQGDNYTPSDEECGEIAREFRSFAKDVQHASEQSLGLIWISS